jgi:thiol:disulfide interchange protein/DsbC/DsbD-like thiol-disulfide interchange protein
MHWLHGMQRALSCLVLALLALLGLEPAYSQSVQAALAGKAAGSAVVITDQVRAELLAHAPQGIGPGRKVWLGLRLAHQDGWHTYWKNPGDSGLPTTLQWTLPEGVQAGDIAWPAPKKFPLGELANYGYEGTVLLPVPLRIADSFKTDALVLRLQASWLVCRRECIPQDGQFVLSLPTQSSTASHGAAFEAALAAQPRELPAGESRIEVREQTLQIALAGLPTEARGGKLELFAETAAIIETAGAWQQSWEGPLWRAQVPLSKLRSEGPDRLPLVLALPDGRAWRIDAPVSGRWPAPAAAATLPPTLEAALKAAAQEAAQRPPHSEPSGAGWLLALLGALLGGLILNLMPCVFPVLAIKALGFSQQRGDRLQQGLAYTAGVLLSFVALGALLLALRAGGQELGWGFQLQNPAIVAALAVLFTLIGLNLAGLFEFTQLAPGRLAALQWRHPAADAALSGVLAVAIASPCTAPFMGASLGAALSLPAWQGLAIFAMLGLGMALPYLLISAVPALGRALPKPGPWMLRLKQVMAFPMLATVIWLMWVLGQQSGIDGVAALMVVLLLMALLLWTLGLQGRGRRVGGMLALLTLAGGLWWAAPQVVRSTAPATASSDGPWQAWRPGLVQQLTAQGRPVLVDFTAAWCITCQYNKKTVLTHPAVLADAQQRQVALLRADWTQRDNAVTAALAELGRAGVPVYALYAPGRPPVLLSEVLSVNELRQALSRL